MGFFSVEFLFKYEWILKIWFLHSSEGLQPFCDELTQRLQEISAVWNDRACLQRNLMHLKKDIQEAPWILVWPYVRAQDFVFFLDQYFRVNFYPLLQKFLHRGGTICCGRWDQTLIGLGISEMIFDRKSKIFQGLNLSWAEAFVGLNNYEVWAPLYKSNCTALTRKEIVVDGEK